MSGSLEGPVKLRLFCQGAGNMVYVSEGFFLDSGIQEIVCKADTTGYQREIPSIHNKVMDQYIPTYFTPEFLALDTVSDYQLHHKLVRKYVRDYTNKYPDSEISLWLLAEYLEYGYEPELDSGYTFLSDRLKTSFTGNRLAEDIQHLRLTAIGQRFPQLVCFDVSGKKKQFYNPALKARYILVDFWFSHCPPCIGQFPDFLEIFKNYQTKGFSMVGISSDTSAGDIVTWKQVIHEKGLTWIQYRTDEISMKNLRINLAPSNFLLDSQGIIIAKDLDTHEVDEFLKGRLK